MVEYHYVGYINPEYSLNRIYFQYLKTPLEPESASPVEQRQLLGFCGNFRWLKLYLFITILFRNTAKCQMSLVLLIFSIFLLGDITQISQPPMPKCLVAFFEAILEHRYFLHLKETNLISRKSVKIYLYCLDSQMYWKSLTLLMAMASTGDNERIYGNRLSMKMNIPLPQYYDKFLIYGCQFK